MREPAVGALRVLGRRPGQRDGGDGVAPTRHGLHLNLFTTLPGGAKCSTPRPFPGILSDRHCSAMSLSICSSLPPHPPPTPAEAAQNSAPTPHVAACIRPPATGARLVGAGIEAGGLGVTEGNPRRWTTEGSAASRRVAV